MSQLNLGTSLILDSDYSTSEVKTGATWTDGKPIYSKVITGNTASSGGAGGRRSIAHGIANIDHIVQIAGFMEAGTGYTQQLNFDLHSANYSVVFRNGANIIQESGTDSPLNAPMWIVLYYTKTTD